MWHKLFALAGQDISSYLGRSDLRMKLVHCLAEKLDSHLIEKQRSRWTQGTTSFATDELFGCHSWIWFYFWCVLYQVNFLKCVLSQNHVCMCLATKRVHNQTGALVLDLVLGCEAISVLGVGLVVHQSCLRAVMVLFVVIILLVLHSATLHLLHHRVRARAREDDEQLYQHQEPTSTGRSQPDLEHGVEVLPVSVVLHHNHDEGQDVHQVGQQDVAGGVIETDGVNQQEQEEVKANDTEGDVFCSVLFIDDILAE